MNPIKISKNYFNSTLYRVKLKFDYGYCFTKIIDTQFGVKVVKVLNEYLEKDEPEIFRVEDFKYIELLTHDFLTFEYPRSNEWCEIKEFENQDIDYLFPDLKSSAQFLPPLSFESFNSESRLNWYLIREFSEENTNPANYEDVKHLGNSSAWDLETITHVLTILWKRNHGHSLESVRTEYTDELLDQKSELMFALDIAMKAPFYCCGGIDKNLWNQARNLSSTD